MRSPSLVTLILLLCCAHGITDAFLWDLFGSLEKNSNDKASDNLQLKEEHSIAKREAEDEVASDIEDEVEREIEAIDHENDFEHDSVDEREFDPDMLVRMRRWLEHDGVGKYSLDMNLQDEEEEEYMDDHLLLRHRRFADLMDMDDLGLDDLGIDESSDGEFDFGDLGLDSDLLGGFGFEEDEDDSAEDTLDTEADDTGDDSSEVMGLPEQPPVKVAVAQTIPKNVQPVVSQPANTRRLEEEQCDENSALCDSGGRDVTQDVDEEEEEKVPVRKLKKKKKHRRKKQRGRGKARKNRKNRKRKGKKDRRERKNRKGKSRSRSRGRTGRRRYRGRHRGRTRGKSSSRWRGRRGVLEDLGIADLGIDLDDIDGDSDEDELIETEVIVTDAPPKLGQNIPEAIRGAYLKAKQLQADKSKNRRKIVQAVPPNGPPVKYNPVAQNMDSLRAMFMRAKKNQVPTSTAQRLAPRKPASSGNRNEALQAMFLRAKKMQKERASNNIINKPSIGPVKRPVYRKPSSAGNKNEVLQAMFQRAKKLQNDRANNNKINKLASMPVIPKPPDRERNSDLYVMYMLNKAKHDTLKREQLRKARQNRMKNLRTNEYKINRKRRDVLDKYTQERMERSVDEDIDDSNESDFTEAAEVDVFGDGEHVEAIRRNLRDVYDRLRQLEQLMKCTGKFSRSTRPTAQKCKSEQDDEDDGEEDDDDEMDGEVDDEANDDTNEDDDELDEEDSDENQGKASNGQLARSKQERTYHVDHGNKWKEALEWIGRIEDHDIHEAEQQQQAKQIDAKDVNNPGKGQPDGEHHPTQEEHTAQETDQKLSGMLAEALVKNSKEPKDKTQKPEDVDKVKVENKVDTAKQTPDQGSKAPQETKQGHMGEEQSDHKNQPDSHAKFDNKEKGQSDDVKLAKQDVTTEKPH